MKRETQQEASTRSYPILRFQPLLSDAGWVLFGAGLLFLVRGFVLDTGGNHPLQLVVVHKILNPNLYPNDPFVNQTWYAYTSVLWRLLAHLIRLVGYETAITGLFVLNRLLLSLAALYVARALFGKYAFAPTVGLLALLTFPNSWIGDGQPVKNYLEQTGLAFGLGLLALVGLTRQCAWCVVLGIAGAFCFNAMYGGFLITYMIVTIATTAALRSEWRRWIGWGVLGVMLGAPGWLPTLLMGAQAYSIEDVWKVSEIGYTGHFYLYSKQDNLLFFLSVGITLLTLRRGAHLEHAYRAYLWRWTWIALGWYGVAQLAPLLPSPTLLRLHPMRGHDYWHFIAAVNFWGYLTIGIQRFIMQRRAPDWAVLGVNWLPAAVLVGAVLLPFRQSLREQGGVMQAIFPSRPQEVYRLAKWARVHTPPEAVFLIPIQRGSPWIHFRHLSQRNVFLNWKDASAWPYAPWYSTVFLQQIRAIGFFEEFQINESEYQRGAWLRQGVFALHRKFRINEPTVKRLMRQYRLDYWITEKQTPTTFPIVYESDGYKVLKLSD